MTQDEIADCLVIAKEAVLRAGTFLSKPNQRIVDINIETRRDIKICADTESEHIILDYLKEKSCFSILSEESGILDGGDNRFTWIVDPLDGSLNYARGIPLCCVSVGLWQGDKPVLGAVYDFNRHELFTGIAGMESWLNEKKIGVSSISKKEAAVLCTGFPVNTDFSLEGLTTFVKDVQDYRKVRLMGTAALSLAYVASGKADAYMENDIMIWDVAGGVAIASGSGCICNIKMGSKHNSVHVSVTNGKFNIDR